ncbi:hypothetical protein C8A01DRAFT_42220, partial [Parachaetomium inaequale]
MTVVTKLGLKYLWVDRYCIPQNDPVARKAQIQQMGEIYSRSALTIIAAAGSSPEHGLPGEGLLSPRRLLFTDHAAYFQCGKMYCYENLTRPIYNLKASTLMAFDADKVFVRIFPVAKSPPGELIKRITTFFEREMSVDNDVLDALAGIFAEFRNRPRVSDEMVSRGSIITAHCDTPEVSLDRVDTLYGLPLYPKHAFQWQYNLCPTAIVALALCWDIYGPVLRRKDFPSWSWAGWKVDRTPERTQPYKYRH